LPHDEHGVHELLHLPEEVPDSFAADPAHDPNARGLRNPVPLQHLPLQNLVPPQSTNSDQKYSGLSAICLFQLVDHFYETHTGGSSTQCPLCLKVFFASGSRSRSSTSNLMAFYQHLVGHKRQSNRRKCERCCLIFQQSKHVYEHEDQDHRSMRNVPRVVAVVSTESNPTIIIPTPTGPPPLLQAEKAGEVSKCAKF